MEQTMGGFCIPASLALRNALEESGYDDSRVVRGRFQNKGHAWVETQGKIIDIILDQFGGFPSICISDVGDMRYSAVSPPYTFFLLNDDMELNRNRQLFI